MLEPFRVVRVRPDTMATVGLTKPRLKEVAELFSQYVEDGSPMPDTDRLTTTQLFPANDCSPDYSDDISSALLQSFAAANHCVYDIDFRASRLRQLDIDYVLANGLLLASSALTPDHRILILVERIIAPSDLLAIAVQQIGQLCPVAVIDSNGGVDPCSTWTPPKALTDLVRVTRDDLTSDIAAKVLRRRGVFRHHGQDEYTAFRFSLHLCLPALRTLLRREVETTLPDLVVFDGPSGGWLRDALLQEMASNPLAIPAFDVAHVLDDEDGPQVATVRQRFEEAVGTGNAVALLVVPLLNSGRSVTSLVERLQGQGLRHIQVLTVMVNRWMLTDSGLPRSLHIDGQDVRVDCLLPVDHHVLADDDPWLRAALDSGLVEDPAADWHGPSLLGLWQLFDFVGCRREEPTPKRRQPIQWFPEIAKMGPEDSLWLAECLTRLVEARLGVNRDRVLILLPNEPSGATPIARALKDRLDVAIQLIDRDVIDGKVEPDGRLVQKLQDYASKKFVVADESTVTYGTVRAIARLLRSLAQRPPDLAVVALELPSPEAEERPSYLHSLHGWRPLTFAVAG